MLNGYRNEWPSSGGFARDAYMSVTPSSKHFSALLNKPKLATFLGFIVLVTGLFLFSVGWIPAVATMIAAVIWWQYLLLGPSIHIDNSEYARWRNYTLPMEWAYNKMPKDRRKQYGKFLERGYLDSDFARRAEKLFDSYAITTPPVKDVLLEELDHELA